MDEDTDKKDEEITTTVEPEVQEGEIVSADLQSDDAASSDATILESLESLIRENLAKVARLQDEMGKHKEMLDSILENDEVYKQHSDAAKAATKIKSGTKNEILKRPDVSHVNNKVKELALEIKESKDSLNSYLPEYQRLSGSNEINDENGEPMQIIYQAKLIRRRP